MAKTPARKTSEETVAENDSALNASEQQAKAIEAMKKGHAADAEAFARGASAAWPDDSELIFTLAWVLHESGKVAEAEAEYRRIIQRPSLHASAWFNLGNLLKSTGRGAEAEGAWRKAAKLGHEKAAKMFE